MCLELGYFEGAPTAGRWQLQECVARVCNIASAWDIYQGGLTQPRVQQLKPCSQCSKRYRVAKV